MTEILTQTAEQLRQLVTELKTSGRYDLIAKAIGMATIEKLCVENAKNSLSRIIVTDDWRITLPDYDCELDLDPIHRTVYIFFLRHEEGIEFKRLSEYRQELVDLYTNVLNANNEAVGVFHRKRKVTQEQINETIDRLVNPLDNAINEKCSRIKRALASLMDKFQLQYYIISGHKEKKIEGFDHVWYERKKVITIDRSLVIMPE